MRPIYIMPLIISAYLLSRIYYINGDIPLGWKLIWYQQFDELFYSIDSINYFYYKTITPKIFGLSYEFPTFGSIQISSLLTYFSLITFKELLTGIRMPVVFVGLVSYLIYVYLLIRLQVGLSNSKIYFYAFLIIPLFDPFFYYSNVIQEPSAYRLIIAMIVLMMTLSGWGNSRFKAFIIGYICSAAIFFVYPQTAFLSIYSFITIFYEKDKSNKFINFILGWSLGVLTWYFIYKNTFETPLLETFEMLRGVREPSNPLSIKLLSNNLISILKTNFIAFSPISSAIFYFSICSLIANYSLFIKNKFLVKICIFFFAFILQSQISFDFPERKIISLYFPILLFIFLVLRNVGKSRLWVTVLLAAIFFKVAYLSSTNLVDRGYFDVGILSNKYEYLALYSLVFLALLSSLIYTKLTSSIINLCIFLSIAWSATFLYAHHLSNQQTYSNLIKKIAELPDGYLVAGRGYAFSGANKHLKPFYYTYYNKFKKLNVDSDGFSKIEIDAIETFRKLSAEPVYIVFQEFGYREVINRFPSAKLIIYEDNFNDVESYGTIKSPYTEIPLINKRKIAVYKIN